MVVAPPIPVTLTDLPRSYSKAGRAPQNNNRALKTSAFESCRARASSAPARSGGFDAGSRNAEAISLLSEVGEQVWLSSAFVASALETVRRDHVRVESTDGHDDDAPTIPSRNSPTEQLSPEDADRARRLTSSPRLYDRRVLRQVAREAVRGQVDRFVRATFAAGSDAAAAAAVPDQRKTLHDGEQGGPVALVAGGDTRLMQVAPPPRDAAANGRETHPQWRRLPCSTFVTAAATGMPSASMASSSPRFASDASRAPPVGHYHPKYHMVSSRPPAAIIVATEDATTGRKTDFGERGEQAACVAASAAAVPTELAAADDLAPEATHAAVVGGVQAPQVVRSGHDVAGPVSKTATLAFKSQQPRLPPPRRSYEAPNGPVNLEGTLPTTPRPVSLAKRLGRDQHRTGWAPRQPQAANTTYDYNIDVLSGKGSHRGTYVDIERRGTRSDRRLPMTARGGVLVAAVAGVSHWSDSITVAGYGVAAPAPRPSTSGGSLRAPNFDRTMPRPPLYKSINNISQFAADLPEVLPRPDERHVPRIDFSRMRPERDATKIKRECGVEYYDADPSITSPRTDRTLAWRPGRSEPPPPTAASGHAGAAPPSSSHWPSSVAIAAYDATRPRRVYDIDFSSFTNRPPPNGSAARSEPQAIDFAKVDSPLRRPRTTGNPFIAQQSSRQQREQRLMHGVSAADEMPVEDIAEKYGVKVALRVKEQRERAGDLAWLRDGSPLRKGHPNVDFEKTCSREQARGSRAAMDSPL